jgi:hypothetical protein
MKLTAQPTDNPLDATGLRVYAQRMKLTKATDALYRGKCPFHADYLSFKVVLDHEQWRFECTSCNAKGDATEFILRFDSLPDQVSELWIRIPMAVWKRYAEIGEAMCLYGHLISWTTTEIPDPDNPGKKLGIIHGGEPQSDKQIAEEIGCHRSTVLRQRETLIAVGLLLQMRGQYGHRLAIRCSDKWSAKRQGKASSYPWIDEARCSKVATSEDSRCSTPAHQMLQGCTPDVARLHARSSTSATPKRRNPNAPQELRSRKPKKAYRKHRESLAPKSGADPLSSSHTEAADAAGGQRSVTERRSVCSEYLVWLNQTWLDLSLSKRQKYQVRQFIFESPFDPVVLRGATKKILDTLNVTNSYDRAGERLAENLPEKCVAFQKELDQQRAEGEAMARQKAEMTSRPFLVEEPDDLPFELELPEEDLEPAAEAAA